MIASQSEIRSRIDDLKLSYSGYRRQLDSLDLTKERRQRLESDTRLLGDEMEALGRVAQLARLEPDREKVEGAIREKLEEVRRGLAADPTLAPYSEEERDLVSGEARALRWVLGEEPLARHAAGMVQGHEKADPARTDQALPSLLIRMLANGPNAEARASAAYEIGRLGVGQAIPALVEALGDDRIVAEMALVALARFSDDELRQADIDEAILARVSAERDQSKKNER